MATVELAAAVAPAVVALLPVAPDILPRLPPISCKQYKTRLYKSPSQAKIWLNTGISRNRIYDTLKMKIQYRLFYKTLNPCNCKAFSPKSYPHMKQKNKEKNRLETK